MTRTREENALDMWQDELDKLRADEQEPEVELDYFWFPWCKHYYVDDYANEKAAELRASGDYWDARNNRGQIQILVAHNPDAWDDDGKLVECTFIDRREAIEKGLVKEV